MSFNDNAQLDTSQVESGGSSWAVAAAGASPAASRSVAASAASSCSSSR